MFIDYRMCVCMALRVNRTLKGRQPRDDRTNIVVFSNLWNNYIRNFWLYMMNAKRNDNPRNWKNVEWITYIFCCCYGVDVTEHIMCNPLTSIFRVCALRRH